LLTASAFFLFAYSLLVLAARLTEGPRAALIALICVIWAAYVVDLIVRLSDLSADGRALGDGHDA
jgi:hypothetical protein